MVESIRAVARGRVQGVGFRDFVARTAGGLRLVGSVRNLGDGTVEVVAEGDPAALESLLGALRKGPALARVEGVSVSRGQAGGRRSSFDVIF